ncbi:MAG: membrane protein of unknown function [Candidatus Thorarchaeota archaeon]|nr:MAG: membrane protein of unknown function [Candidatus Thorarchaeota archaeon]
MKLAIRETGVRTKNISIRPKLEYYRQFLLTGKGIIVHQVFSTLLFWILIYFRMNHTLLVLQTPVAFLSLVLFPGMVISTQVVPKKYQGLGMSSGIGIAIAILEIHIGFLTKLSIGFSFPVSILLPTINIVVMLGAYITKDEEIDKMLPNTLRIPKNKAIILVIIFGFFLRVILAFLNYNALSPDGALFANYANGILSGSYDTTLIDDVSVYNLWNGVQYIIHQGYAYALAVSFLMLPPFDVGPVIILPIIGIILALIGIHLVNALYGEVSAIFASVLLSFNPLLIFHSTVGYGPEILSILFLLIFAVLFFHKKHDIKTLSFAGILLGLIDVIWYSNFYIVSIIIPFMAYGMLKLDRREFFLISILMMSILLLKILFRLTIIYYVGISTVILSLFILLNIQSFASFREFSAFIGLTLAIITLWRFPLQVINSIPTQNTITETPIIPIIFSPIPIEVTLSFVFFFIFHVSLPILIISGIVLWRGRSERNISLLLSCLVVALGTLKVFSVIPGSLQIFYIYSDSRFFILMSTLMVFIACSYLRSIEVPEISSIELSLHFLSRENNRKILGVCLISMVGFIPGFLMMPTGYDLIQLEKRYGWAGIEDAIEQIGNEDTKFLVDRAREFAWITHRQTVVLELTKAGLTDAEAEQQILQLVNRFNVEYLVIDRITVARWGVFESLLFDAMEINSSIPLDYAPASQINDNESVMLQSVKLVDELRSSSGHIDVRIFQFSNITYAATDVKVITPNQWEAGNNGTLSFIDDYTILTIGQNRNYTFTTVKDDYSLDWHVKTGFVSLRVSEINATITRVSIWDDSENLLGCAFQIDESLWIFDVGNIEIGDIKIVIQGEANCSISIGQISNWQSVMS